MGRNRIDKNKIREGNDYPLFGYRVDSKTHKALKREIESILRLYNADTNDFAGGKETRKSLFLKALKIGFRELRKRKG